MTFTVVGPLQLPDNTPAAGVTLIFTPNPSPFVDASGVLTIREASVTTDSAGNFAIQLERVDGLQYFVRAQTGSPFTPFYFDVPADGVTVTIASRVGLPVSAAQPPPAASTTALNAEAAAARAAELALRNLTDTTLKANLDHAYVTPVDETGAPITGHRARIVFNAAGVPLDIVLLEG